MVGAYLGRVFGNILYRYSGPGFDYANEIVYVLKVIACSVQGNQPPTNIPINGSSDPYKDPRSPPSI